MTTVDDLTRLAMREAQDFRNKMLVTGQSYSPHDEYYVFTRSIVRALRDEMRHMTLNRDSLEELFTQILGSDAGEKVAGGSTREDEKAVEAAGDKGPVSVNSPATDAAPAHEWFQFSNLVACRACGVVRRADDKNNPCKGPVRVALRDTDAAPAVCVWECGPVPDKKGLVRVTSKCAGFESVRSELVIGRASHNCPSCGKPITFKEANHG